jgi:hypothetical protein
MPFTSITWYAIFNFIYPFRNLPLQGHLPEKKEKYKYT